MLAGGPEPPRVSRGHGPATSPQPPWDPRERGLLRRRAAGRQGLRTRAEDRRAAPAGERAHVPARPRLPSLRPGRREEAGGTNPSGTETGRPQVLAQCRSEAATHVGPHAGGFGSKGQTPRKQDDGRRLRSRGARAALQREKTVACGQPPRNTNPQPRTFTAVRPDDRGGPEAHPSGSTGPEGETTPHGWGSSQCPAWTQGRHTGRCGLGHRQPRGQRALGLPQNCSPRSRGQRERPC